MKTRDRLRASSQAHRPPSCRRSGNAAQAASTAPRSGTGPGTPASCEQLPGRPCRRILDRARRRARGGLCASGLVPDEAEAISGSQQKKPIELIDEAYRWRRCWTCPCRSDPPCLSACSSHGAGRRLVQLRRRQPSASSRRAILIAVIVASFFVHGSGDGEGCFIPFIMNCQRNTLSLHEAVSLSLSPRQWVHSESASWVMSLPGSGRWTGRGP